MCLVVGAEQLKELSLHDNSFSVFGSGGKAVNPLSERSNSLISSSFI